MACVIYNSNAPWYCGCTIWDSMLGCAKYQVTANDMVAQMPFGGSSDPTLVAQAQTQMAGVLNNTNFNQGMAVANCQDSIGGSIFGCDANGNVQSPTLGNMPWWLLGIVGVIGVIVLLPSTRRGYQG
jgi:hypothetical protein